MTLNTNLSQQLLIRAEEHYRAVSQQRPLPQLTVRQRSVPDQADYLATCRAGALEICAESPLILAQAIYRTTIGLLSGSPADFLGLQRKKFSDGLLALQGDMTVSLEAGCSIVYQRALEPDALLGFASRLLELGYNGIVFGMDQGVATPCEGSLQDLTDSVQQLAELGIQVALTVRPPTGGEFSLENLRLSIAQLVRAIPEASGLWWRSCLEDKRYRDIFGDEGSTFTECLLNETEFLESCVLGEPQSLTLFLPEIPKFLDVSRFLDSVGPKMRVAFEGHSGGLNPMWDALDSRREPCTTPLLPIVHEGTQRQGGGLWPVLAHRCVADLMARMRRHAFLGLVCCAPHMPEGQGMMACNLWTIAHSAWGTASLDTLTRRWFEALRPDMTYLESIQQLNVVHSIAQHFAQIVAIADNDPLGGGVDPALAELLHAELRYLRRHYGGGYSQYTHQSTIELYVQQFVTDIESRLRGLSLTLQASCLRPQTPDDDCAVSELLARENGPCSC